MNHNEGKQSSDNWQSREVDKLNKMCASAVLRHLGLNLSVTGKEVCGLEKGGDFKFMEV